MSRTASGLIVGWGISTVWCALIIRLGPRLGFVDKPDDPLLKAHSRPAVPLGGVGVFLAVHAFLALVGRFDVALLLVSALLLAVGLADDRRALSPGLRLGGQVTAAFLLMVLSPPFGGHGPLFALVAATLIVVGINAVNLFDGLDGLVGASGLIAGLGLWSISLLRGNDQPVGVALSAALAGFLVYNWHQASVFLGDHGSYVVGLFLVYGAALATPGGSIPDFLIVCGVLGVFGLDLLVTVVRRLVRRRPLFAGDRSHLYDQLVDRGLSVAQVALLSAFVEVAIVAIVVVVDRAVGGWRGVLGLGLLTTVLIGVVWVGGFVAQGSARNH